MSEYDIFYSSAMLIFEVRNSNIVIEIAREMKKMLDNVIFLGCRRTTFFQYSPVMYIYTLVSLNDQL